MSLTVVASQAAPLAIDAPRELFEQACSAMLTKTPDGGMLVFPEMHLFADGQPDRARTNAYQQAAEPLDGPRVTWLRQLAAGLGVWLVPGTVCERGPSGELFNTALAIRPDGEVAATYRKIFPWRPLEPFTPGQDFAVFDVPGAGRMGLCICFDSWFPEVSRNLAWLGAETIINVVKTTTPDRPQEMVMARANAIVNQVNFLSVNAAAPVGRGLSAFFGPEGETLAEIGDDAPADMVCEVSTQRVRRARAEGTAGVTRPWAFFHSGDQPVELPAYGGRIDPTRWNRD
ncbi:carbon-nitrogen hydrolase family protein [Propionibacterium sp.]|uniref:carbon-nitrogen hydrolase family protein n=1 Tax=Propionibacterium sp. TaxID=1977903 RepID=UPI00345E3A76